MEIDEFLDKLSKQAHVKKWMVIPNYKKIRAQDGQECPISSLLNTNLVSFTSVGHRIGLSNDDIRTIAIAADNKTEDLHGRTLDIRNKMLKVLGLEDEECRSSAE